MFRCDILLLFHGCCKEIDYVNNAEYCLINSISFADYSKDSFADYSKDFV